jgi:hypothetical protein
LAESRKVGTKEEGFQNLFFIPKRAYLLLAKGFFFVCIFCIKRFVAKVEIQKTKKTTNIIQYMLYLRKRKISQKRLRREGKKERNGERREN